MPSRANGVGGRDAAFMCGALHCRFLKEIGLMVSNPHEARLGSEVTADSFQILRHGYKRRPQLRVGGTKHEIVPENRFGRRSDVVHCAATPRHDLAKNNLS